MRALALLALLQVAPPAPAAFPPQAPVDPALQSAVERFFATQEAEDAAGYLALWSKTAQVPQLQQLQFIFESGDDKFSDLVIERATVIGNQARVRLRVTRQRTDTRNKRPDGTPMVFNSRIFWSLSFVREGEEWKIIREGTPLDELAVALLAASTAEDRKAIAAAEPDLLNERLIDAMARRGDAEAQKQQYAAAKLTYERMLDVARMIGNKRGEGKALQNLGNAHYFLRQFPQAFEMFEARLAIEREIKNDEGIANALSGVGSVRYALFEYTDSLTSYREAASVFERIQDKLGLASSLISTGNILYLQGDYEGAIADYRRSRELYRSLAYLAGEARALEGLGLCLSAQGDLGAALDAYGGVLEEGRARSDLRAQATVLFNIGEIHVRLSNLETARAQFEQSRGFYEQMKDPANVGRAWRGIALTDLIAARFSAAEQGYVKSQAACAIAVEQGCIASALVGQAFAQAAQEHFDQAIGTYGKAIALITALAKSATIAAERRTLFEEAARAELGLSRALDGKKDHAAALAAAQRAREQAQQLKSDDVVWRALVAEARALRRLRQPERALKTATEALTAIERIRLHTLERPDARLSSDSVEAFALVAVLRTEAGDTAAAFAAAEDRRALALRLAVAANEREIHQGMTPEERAQERAAAGALVALHLKRDREKGLPKPDAARLERLDKAIAEATATRAVEQRKLFERLPALRRWRALEPAAGVDALARVVAAPGSVVLQFVVDEDEVLVMTAVPAESGPVLASHVSPVSRQKLAERVAALNELATLRDVSAWRKAALEIANVLPPAVRKLLASSRTAVVIPDDVLWRVPFEALPVEDRFLGDFLTVSYAGSITGLAASPEPRGDGAPVALVAVGAPLVGDAIRERLKSTAPGWTLRAPESADREIKDAAKIYQDPPPTLLLGAAATEDALRAELERAALIHIAGPFRTNSASPLFSPLLLSTPAMERPESAVDGIVEAREIMNLRLRARAAVVTDGMAMSMRNAAAATPTLQWTWLAAGVPAVVLPRWLSEDAASDALVSELHARLKAGDAPADALHAARMKIRKADATAAPYFWAGWMVVGR